MYIGMKLMDSYLKEMSMIYSSPRLKLLLRSIIKDEISCCSALLPIGGRI
jgi:hypothetical protein